MRREVFLDPLKPQEVEMARNMIERNHPLRGVSLFKVLPFLEILTCRACRKRPDEQGYVQMDEHKLLKFQRMKHTETEKERQKRENAEHLKNKLIEVAAPRIQEIMDADPNTAKEVIQEHNKIEEEDKERDIGTFMHKRDTKADIEMEKFDDDNEMEEVVLTSPILKEKPFLYLGFGINLYFDFLKILILTMAII